uniref:Uncharacterized protein n=1 Tax=Triticum urartu TaxID=4572 RepID=A0A8R7TY19_TRIUA
MGYIKAGRNQVFQGSSINSVNRHEFHIRMKIKHNQGPLLTY